jgi:hypothetical protein
MSMRLCQLPISDFFGLASSLEMKDLLYWCSIGVIIIPFEGGVLNLSQAWS